MVRLGYRQRLSATYVLVVMISLLLITGCLTSAIHGHLVSRTDHELTTDAMLVAEVVRNMLVQTQSPAAIDLMADGLGAKTGLRVTVIAADGTVLGDSQGNPVSMENHGNRPEVLQAYRSGVGLITRYSVSLGSGLRYCAVPVTTSAGDVIGYVRVAASLAQVEQSSAAVRGFMLNAVGIAAIAGVALSLVLSKGISDPLKNMATAARAIARGDFSRKVRARSNDELGQLAEAFNHMARELEQSVGEISRQKNQMETILSAMADGVVAVDASQRILLVNQAACDMFGARADQALNRHILEIVRNRDLADSLAIASAGSDDIRETTAQSPRALSLRIHAAPISGASGSGAAGAVAVLQDVTDLRRLELVRQDFVSNVSHELRTPVTSIKGFADTLLDGAMEDGETLRRFLELIDREADRLAHIISDLLDLSRLECTNASMPLSPVMISDAAQRALEAVQSKAEGKSIQVLLQIPAELPAVQGDEPLIVQVLVNLLENAVKYTPDGGSIVVSASCVGATVRVDVSDTGVGIPVEHLPRIFERFYRVDRARSRQLGGTGLGLSIVKHIVERHGGEAWASSVPGRGSTFSFTVPVWASSGHM